MKLTQFLLISVVLLLGSEAFGQSNLPGCPGTAMPWHYCFGSRKELDGSKYIGEFMYDRYNGRGTWTSPDGFKYNGEFKNHKFEGKGTKTYPNGDEYIGEFKDDDLDGLGTFRWANGYQYIGEMLDGRRSGMGILYLPDGSVSESGLWKDNELVRSRYVDSKSFARIVKSNGDALAGRTSQNKEEDADFQARINQLSKYHTTYRPCNGRNVSAWERCIGKYVFLNGAKYYGDFDKSFDVGDPIYPNGDKLDDDFINSKSISKYYIKFSGTGSYTFSNGNRYIGNFKDNHFNGQGILISKDGVKYIGEWRNSKLNGGGIIFKADGSIKESGIYKNSKLVENQYVDIEDILAWYQKVDKQMERYAADFSVPEVRQLSPAVKAILQEMVEAEDERENKKYSGASANQGKTGPVGLGSIKLGMLAKEIKILPSSEFIRIDKWGEVNEADKYSCHLREKYDSNKDPNRLPCINVEHWLISPRKYPAKVKVEVEIFNPFVASLPGSLNFVNGILTSIEMNLYKRSIFEWVDPAKVNLPHFKISGVSDYDSEILSDALHDEFKIMLIEKYGKVSPLVKSKKKLCGKDTYDETLTRYEWSDKNKLLGTVISRS